MTQLYMQEGINKAQGINKNESLPDARMMAFGDPSNRTPFNQPTIFHHQ